MVPEHTAMERLEKGVGHPTGWLQSPQKVTGTLNKVEFLDLQAQVYDFTVTREDVTVTFALFRKGNI